jgi:putative transposase
MGTVKFGIVIQCTDGHLHRTKLPRLPLPREVISHCVWLYFRFCLSFRDVQEMMFDRGIEVSHEAIRLWTLKFGAEYARRLRRRVARHGDTRLLDEVFCKAN